jgi:8-oxo-dGTP diphosphatase
MYYLHLVFVFAVQGGMMNQNNDFTSSVDVLFDINDRYVLIVKRANSPFKGFWALPGCVQNRFESLNDAVLRLLKQKLGLSVGLIERASTTFLKFPMLDKEAILAQVKTYDSGTDPRGGNTTLFCIQINVDKNKLVHALQKSEFVSEFSIVEKDKLPELAFDHKNFINEYYSKLRPFKDSPKNYDPSRYEKPSVSVDTLIFTIRSSRLEILLIKRKSWPFENQWAIPGGFIDMDESLEESALRKLRDETSLRDVYLEQLYTFGEPKRDPRTRVITISYYALIASDNIKLNASGHASDVTWFDVDSLPKLAFDHGAIIDYALERIRSKIEYTNIAVNLLPEKFTLTEFQRIYEVILGKSLDKRNFRKKVYEVGLLTPLNETKMDGAHRPAQLFMFRKDSSKAVLKAEKKL